MTKAPERMEVLLLRLCPSVYKHSNHPVSYRPPYILKFIEALLLQKQDVHVRCIDQQIRPISFEEIVDRIKTAKPLALVLDVSVLNLDASINLANTLKELKLSPVTVIGVGQEVSASISTFRKSYPGFDLLFAGEAEQQVLKVIEQLRNGQSVEDIKGQYISAHTEDKIWTIEDIDSLPFLSYDRDEIKGYSFVYPLNIIKRVVWGHMLTSRGCPHQCIFCSQLMRESYGSNLRLRSAPRVVDEMQNLLKQGANIIAFDDENFTSSRAHVLAICQEIQNRKLRVPWIIHARVDELDQEILQMLFKSGCILIRLGIETPTVRLLTTLKKARAVNHWAMKSEEVVRQAKAIGLQVACLFMVGCPTETRKELQSNIEFSKCLNPDIIQVAYFIPYPGSKAYDLYKNQLSHLNVYDLYHYNSPRFNVSSMTDEELKEAQNIFYRSFLFRPLYLLRHLTRYLLFYILNFDVFLRLIRISRNIH